jgi:hypothetical protein
MDAWADLRIVDVAALPGFHNPFKCARRDVFNRAVHEAVRAGRRPWQVWKPPARELMGSLPVEEGEAVMRAVRDSFGPGEARECRRLCVYHQVDWIDVAGRACALVETHGATLRAAAIDAAAEQLPDPDGAFLWSLFETPLKWYPSSPTLTDGQHRACGLVVGNARRVPVAPGPGTLEAEQAEPLDIPALGEITR